MVEDGYLIDPKKRFSSRVENYIKYRPDYPPIIIEFLIKNNILSNKSIIADIGSGTGILSKYFLNNGNKVYGIEPNNDMRNAAENLLKNYPDFISIDGSAEKTGLKNGSIDLITAGQAFHWFNVKQAKKEFKRILKPNGYVALIWNNRRKTGKGFSSHYEEFILKYGTDYKQVRKTEKNVDEFFQYKKSVFYNYQDLDFNGLKGRLLSVSYIPLEGGPNYEKMLDELKMIFEENMKNGRVRIEYDTEIYYGKLN
ncbi:MAG: class I SAM-dependent methyltransferase [Candidatus Hodarchaeota archaeon]